MSLGHHLAAIRQDTGFAFRMLRKRPGFTAVAVLTLGLGIGATTAIFSVVNAVLLRPPPYAEPDRLVRFETHVNTPVGLRSFAALPVTGALTWRKTSETLSSLAVYNEESLTLTTPDGPYRLHGTTASPDFFELLQVFPTIGRTFAAAAETGDGHLVVLSHAAWHRWFGGDLHIVGSTIELNGIGYLVTGVMPEGFGYPDTSTDFWTPLVVQPTEGRGMVLPAIARLAPGATLTSARQEGLTFFEQGSSPDFHIRLEAMTLQDMSVREVRPVLWILMAAVGMVLLIAAVNIALLLLARGAGRRREFSVRMAMGAGRSRLVRQLFIESGILGVIGGAAGLALAALGVQTLIGIAPETLPRLEETAIDSAVLAFTVVVSLTASLLFGVLSAGRTLQLDVVRTMRGSADGVPSADGKRPQRRLKALATAQVAGTVVLLVAAGLLLRSFIHLISIDPGFDARGSLALQVNLPESRYPGRVFRMAFYQSLLERLRQIPEIDDAGLATAMANGPTGANFSFTVAGAPPPTDPFEANSARVRMISEGYFQALGVPLVAGRPFSPNDVSGSTPVVVISETLARRYFPGTDPVGQTITFSSHGDHLVIGVSGDVRPAELGGEPEPSAYLALRQATDMLDWHAGMHVVVRSAGDLPILAAAIRNAVLALDPEMPVFNVRPMTDEIAEVVAGPRFSAVLLVLFASIALGLASVGVFGVLSYSVGQRTKEIGVRMAMGANQRQVLGLVLRSSVLVMTAGMLLGLAGALTLSHLLSTLLYGISATDPATLASVTIVLLGAGMAATYLPARRALQIEPVEALREE